MSHMDLSLTVIPRLRLLIILDCESLCKFLPTSPLKIPNSIRLVASVDGQADQGVRLRVWATIPSALGGQTPCEIKCRRFFKVHSDGDRTMDLCIRGNRVLVNCNVA